MEIELILEKFQKCCDKTGLTYYKATLDEDEIAEVYVDPEAGTLYFFENETPYTADDVESVKYYNDDQYDGTGEDNSYIRFRFRNGDRFRLLASDGVAATIHFGERVEEYERGEVFRIYQQMIEAKQDGTPVEALLSDPDALSEDED